MKLKKLWEGHITIFKLAEEGSSAFEVNQLRLLILEIRKKNEEPQIPVGHLKNINIHMWEF